MTKNTTLNTLLITGILLSSVAWAPAAAAKPTVLYVTPGGDGDCRSWSAACDLQFALDVAEEETAIWVAAGTYYPGSMGASREATFLLKNRVALYGGFSGDEKSLKHRNWKAYPTILSGDIDRNGILDDGNAYHVVTGRDVDASAVLDGFTITAGNANGFILGIVFGGGGMLNESSSPTLANVVFTGNASIERGGGIYNKQSHPTLTHVTFLANWSLAYGGGMYNYYSNPLLIDVAFSANVAAWGGGGMANGIGSPTLVNVSFSDNLATWGGGIDCHQSSAMLINVTFYENTAHYSGGGVYTECLVDDPGCATATLINVTLYGNSAGVDGGAIANLFGGRAALTNVILWNNTAPVGAQIHNRDSSTAVVTYSDVQGGYPGDGNIDSDPLFVNAPAGDLHLQPTSPAIDAGNNDAVPHGIRTDADGRKRFVKIREVDDTGVGHGPIVDFGAYEVQRVKPHPDPRGPLSGWNPLLSDHPVDPR